MDRATQNIIGVVVAFRSYFSIYVSKSHCIACFHNDILVDEISSEDSKVFNIIFR